ncbi:helix-turn-helix transcriptional regulator [Deinococcus aluminii]|uniref:HTH cro/C1-type domain-containing protein n=1 Tax=Deinococcus aluminii TaxID=1656885 RepID=A0ABP9XE78_9DEIO
MPIQSTTYQTQQRGVRITVTGVPTTFSDDGEELGFDLKVMRQLDALVQEALAQAPESGAVELAYAETVPPPDPVSLELRRALRLRKMSGAQVAQQLGVTPPVVSRWLSPNYHQHGMETLRRIADALDMDVEVKLKPRERKAAS